MKSVGDFAILQPLVLLFDEDSSSSSCCVGSIVGRGERDTVHGRQAGGQVLVPEQEVRDGRQVGLCLCITDRPPDGTCCSRFHPAAAAGGCDDRRRFPDISITGVLLRPQTAARLQEQGTVSRLSLMFPQVAVHDELGQALAARVTRLLQVDTRVVVLIQRPIVERLVAAAAGIDPLLCCRSLPS